MNTPTTLERIHGSLLGAQIGDALGMPVETMRHEDIMKLNDGRGVIGFMAPVQRRIEEMAKLKAGDTTDDWQLTKVVAESLIACRGWDKRDCALRHVEALKTSTFGWGGTTTESIRDIMEGRRAPEEPPRNLGPGKGCGNGIIMKVAPLAIWHALKCEKLQRQIPYAHVQIVEPPPQLLQDVMELGFITHHDPRAGIAAFAVAHVIFEQFNELHGLIPNVIQAERQYPPAAGNETVRERLQKVFFPPRIREEGPPAEAYLREAVGCGFHALDTTAFTIGLFIASRKDNFQKVMLTAVNAGGDTDTNASIVGAIMGACYGASSIPEEWRTFRPEFEEARSLARQLYEAAMT